MDNKTNLKIADFTSKIATETQRDSSSMTTMAVVTMAFLPGTFVSALFSMFFFETSTLPNGRTSVSVGDSWWLFPVITISLTTSVFAIWHIWRTRRNAREMNELRRMEHSPYNRPVAIGWRHLTLSTIGRLYRVVRMAFSPSKVLRRSPPDVSLILNRP
ncbi:hypothetical protein FA13DRAFT_622827 [Coprinellus micaceus]|uniref:Uncharacterized protein n=1 Tax=Coprinellus micaceus TaxID=71717 RepID=A0A4Y7T7X0_COPMI|nr:hypothetical protein FA13DRAFT_622827 [Coprinellus micaceus]